MEDDLPGPPQAAALQAEQNYVRFITPERPPESPISAQQTPRLQPSQPSEPAPRSNLAIYEEYNLAGSSPAREPEDDTAGRVRSTSPTPNRQTGQSQGAEGPQLNYKPTLILRGHRKPVACVKYSPDGKWIASGSGDATIKIWDAHTGKHQHTLEGHLAGINDLSWSPDSVILASASDDKTIRLWHTDTGKMNPRIFHGHANYVYSLSFSPKGNMIVSGSYDEAVFLWDVRGARVMRSLPAHSDPVGGIDFIWDGTLIVSCSNDGLIRVWDTASGQCLRTLVHESNVPVTSACFSPNGKFILAWSMDSTIRLWNYVEGKGRVSKTYLGHKNKSYPLNGCFGTYGPEELKLSFIASGSDNGEIFLWDVNSKNIMQKLKGHEGPAMSVATHPTEKLMVSGGMDKTVRIWKMAEEFVPPMPTPAPRDDGEDPSAQATHDDHDEEARNDISQYATPDDTNDVHMEDEDLPSIQRTREDVEPEQVLEESNLTHNEMEVDQR